MQIFRALLLALLAFVVLVKAAPLPDNIEYTTEDVIAADEADGITTPDLDVDLERRQAPAEEEEDVVLDPALFGNGDPEDERRR
ncbi:hypothetical protein HDU96_007015 [Phlyctochytrium bullatum]|nr:hypothetical protein HDU96_007015 [Phlyctochytrium bullatum]